MKNLTEYTEVPTDESQNHHEPEVQLVPVTEIKVEKTAEEEVKTVGLFELFRFSDGLDKFLMFLGFLSAAINGASIPVLMIIFGEMIDTFVGAGILVNYLDTIGDYLQSINTTKWEVVQNPLSLNCKLVGAFYGGNSSSYCLASYISDRLSDDMKQYAIYYCIIGVAVFITAYGQVLFWMTASERQGHRIRRACLTNILRQDIGWFDTHDAAELNTRLGDDVHRIQEGLGDKWGTFVQWMTCSVVSLIIGFVYGWKQALVILAVSPVLIVTATLFSKLAASVSSKELIAYAKAGAVAEEALGAIRTVVAFGGQEKEAEKYKNNLAIAQAFGIKKGFSNGAALGFVWLAVYGCYGLGFWYGVKLYHEDDDYDIPNVIIVAFNVLIFAFALGMAAPSLQVISTARGAAYTIYHLIDCKSQIDSLSDKGMKPKSVTGDIQFQDVDFNYPARPDVKVLDGLTLEAKQGQTVALVGSSGCGKSTVVQLLMRFYDPHQGKITIDGQDIKDLNIKWLRQKIGFVSQEPVLFGTTIAENIRYGQEGITMQGIEEACKKANAYDFIMDLPEKFETLVGERGSQLSGGQKQRIAIARALVRDPKILLLDEATSALDMESESIVQDALDKAREGRTTLVIAHRLSTIKTADLIYGIDNGTVAEMGTHAELMKKKGIYHQLVMNQQTEISDKEKEMDDIINKDKKLYDLGGTKQLMTAEDTELEEEEEDQLPEAPLGRILKLNASEWPFIALGCFGGLANGTVLPAFAVILSEIIKTFSLSEEDQKEEIKMWALLFLGIGFLSFFTFFLQGYMFGQSGERLTTRLRDMSFRSILRQDISYFDKNKNSVGALTTRLATDASLVQGVTGPRLGAVFNSIGNMGTALIISFYYGWKMSLVIIGFLPFMILSGLMQVSLLTGRAGKNKEALEGAGKITVESIGNIRTVASLSKEPKFLSLYMDNLEGPYRSALKSCYIISLMYGLSQCLIFFAWAASFAFGAYMIEEGEMVFNDVFLVFSAIVIGAMGLGTASAFLPDLGKAQMSARYILQIIDSEPALDYSSPKGKKLDTEFNAAVTFNDVEFSYPNRKSVKVLQGTTFSVSPGQTLALVGSSGCGKSTSVQLIERFYDCSAGQVAVADIDIKDLNIKWLREQMGIVFQEPVLFDTTIAKNIAYGVNTRPVKMDEIIGAARKANIHSFISSLPDGYDTNVGARGTQLSGGQKQRIAIARVLVRNPKILLLDEATSALDTESEKIVQEALEKAMEGRTCIAIAHRISTVQNADKICVISQGKVTESGSHNELMAKKGFYFKLVQKSVREA